MKWFSAHHPLPTPVSLICLLQIDRLEVSGLGQTPLAVSCGTDGSFPAGEDGAPDPQRTKQAIAQLQQKILKLTEQIKIEQTARDDNVAEYLQLANNADKQQSTRIKQVTLPVVFCYHFNVRTCCVIISVPC